MAHHQPPALDESSDVAYASNGIHQMAVSTKLSLQTLQRIVHEWRNSLHKVCLEFEASRHAAHRLGALADESEDTLQTIVSLMTRLNFAAVEIDHTIHHQSISRAAAHSHIESIQQRSDALLEAQLDFDNHNLLLKRRLEQLRNWTADLKPPIDPPNA